MSTAKMTLIGLERFQNNANKSLFDNLTFPAGIDKDTAVNKILLDSADFELLYPDVDFMTEAIELWGKVNNRTFEKWVNVLSISYDPLNNYDRTEEIKDSTSRHGTGTATTSSTQINASGEKTVNSDTFNGTVTDTGSSTSTNDIQNKKNAFNSSTATDTDSSHNAGAINNSNTNINNTTASGSSESTGESSSNINGTESSNNTEYIIFKHTARLKGNIGVTTSQQMLQSELDIAEWSLYQHIADLFIAEFCIPVYL